jgi:hypothetical protein
MLKILGTTIKKITCPRLVNPYINGEVSKITNPKSKTYQIWNTYMSDTHCWQSFVNQYLNTVVMSTEDL